MSVNVVVCAACALPVNVGVNVTVKVDVPAGVPGVGAGGVVVPELPPPQPCSSTAAETGSISMHATNARRTARIRPAGLCIHASMMATESSASKNSGKVRIAAGGCILGPSCGAGTAAPLALVLTVMATGAVPPGGTLTGAGTVQVASEGAPEQATATLRVSPGAPPVSEICRV